MNDKKATISLTVIAKYGGEGYRKLIDSAAGNVDEILTILDDNLEDGIAGYHPEIVRYIRRPMNKDFGGQYNFGIKESKSDWIIYLDTDENLTPWLWPHLRFLADCTPEDSVSFPVHNNIIGMQDFLAWPDYHLRLYRKKPSIYWNGQVHPTLQGINTTRMLPSEDRYAIQHVKTLAMQARSEAHYPK